MADRRVAHRMDGKTGDQAGLFRHAATSRAGDYAPLYARLWNAVANDAELLALADHARPGVSQPDLFLACMQYLLGNEIADHPLAAHYPTLREADRVASGDPAVLLREFCLDHHDRLAELLASRMVQTNEVRRCVFLRPAVIRAQQVAGSDRPLALIEVGASAGLLLGMDRYQYDYGTADTYGQSTSPLRLTCELRGTRPAPIAGGGGIAWRAGIDLHPRNPTNPDDVRWLRACVWADHPDRLERLDQAIALASQPAHTVQISAGDATELLPALVDDVPDDLTVVIFHCAFVAHLTPQARADFETLVPRLSTKRRILWVQAEWLANPREPQLRLTVCEHGQVANEVPLAYYHPHGIWLTWVAPAAQQPMTTSAP